MPQLVGSEIAPQSGTVKRLVIFLHGLGADGDDLISLAPMLELPDTQFASPHAPFPCDMAPYGYQWFSLQDRAPTKLIEGVKIAAPILNQYIDTQRDRFKLKDSDIALIGFSQGSMMALYTSLRRAKPLAGVVGFSGALIGGHLLKEEASSTLPICLVHGEEDAIVPFGAMEHAQETLQLHGIDVSAHARPYLGHGIDPEGIEIAKAFLRKCFNF